MSPTLAAHGLVKSADGGDTSTLTKTGLAVSNGDIIVLIGETWSRDHGLNTPTCSGQTVNTVQTAAPGAPSSFWGWAGLWTIKVTGNPGTIDFSCAPADATATRHTLFWAQCTSADLDGSPATNATVSVTGTTATVTLTTAHDNSLIIYGYVDESSRDPANTTYQSSATQVDINDGHIGANSVQASVQQAAATAGSQTIGLANTSSLTLTIVGVEVKAAATTVNGSASLAAAGTLTASAVTTAFGSDTMTATGTLTASGLATALGTAPLTAAGTMGVAGMATAYGTVAMSASGRLTVTFDQDVTASIGAPQRSWSAASPARSWSAGQPQV